MDNTTMMAAAKARLTRARFHLSTHKTFAAFGPLMLQVPTVFDSKIPTACAEKWRIRINPEFFMQFTPEQGAFILLHEVLHVAFRHLTMYKHLSKENPSLANVAMDYVINTMLVDLQAGSDKKVIAFPMLDGQPCGIPHEPRFRGWSTEQVYRELLKEAQANDNSGQGDAGHGEPMDEHVMSSGDDSDDGDGSALTDKEIEAIVDQALREGEEVVKRMGEGSGGAARALQSMLTPPKDWRELLREFLTMTVRGGDDTTWARPHRTLLATGVYLPSAEDRTIDTLAVVFDTSGSTFYSSDLQVFGKELTALIKEIAPRRTLVLHTDTSVNLVQEFNDGQFDLSELKPTGSGGTNLPVAFRWLRENDVLPQACVVLTDGETPYGADPGYPVLWAMTSRARAPYGTTVSIGA